MLAWYEWIKVKLIKEIGGFDFAKAGGIHLGNRDDFHLWVRGQHAQRDERQNTMAETQSLARSLPRREGHWLPM